MWGLPPFDGRPGYQEKDDKNTINSSGRERMAVLDQHIKFLEGNYSVTIAVSQERQT